MDENSLRRLEKRNIVQLDPQQLRPSYVIKPEHGGQNFAKSANNSPNSSVDRKVNVCPMSELKLL